jgi:hypothetical protein
VVLEGGDEVEQPEVVPWGECSHPFPEGRIEQLVVEAKRHTCIVLSHDDEIAEPTTRKVVVVPTIGYNDMSAAFRSAIQKYERLQFFPLPANDDKGIPARYADFSGTFSVPKRFFNRRGMNIKTRLNSDLQIAFMRSYANWLMRIKTPSSPG